VNYNQARCGILGLLVGDALGVPYEFSKPDKLPSLDRLEYEPPKDFTRAHPSVPPGTWSDDGAQALCVLEALLDTLHTDDSFPDVVGQKLLAWQNEGHLAVDGKVFDIGITTARALKRLEACKQASKSGELGSKTNGSLMRTLPTAFMEGYDDDYVLRAAMGQSKVTHAEIEPMLACGIYVLWARGVAEGDPNAWKAAFDRAHRTLPKGILTMFLMDLERWKGPCTGSGYVTDALYSAKAAVDNGIDFESTIRLAIQYGNDTDTTAAIAGGIAGIKYQQIPERWLRGLRGQEILAPLLERLAGHYTAQETNGVP
jgi:ADP-ribosyl-[dinitrogen reductase] hydrolase